LFSSFFSSKKNKPENEKSSKLFENFQKTKQKEAIARGASNPPPIRSLFPNLSESVTGSLDAVFRFSLFAISLLLTLRLGRVYDR